MSDGLRNTIAIVANVCVAVAVPAIIATQADLEGNYQGTNGPLNELVSKNLDFDLSNYQGCANGEILMNGFCEPEPRNQVECGVPDNSEQKWNGSPFRRWDPFWGRKRRAVNGTIPTTVEEAMPWNVQFQKPNNAGSCSGAIIGKNHVLSSAECHANYLNAPLDFVTIHGDKISVTKVSIPTDEEMCEGASSNRAFSWDKIFGRKRRDVGCVYDESSKSFKWDKIFGRKRRGTNSFDHDISLHETAAAIWSSNDIVPVCVNRPSLSLFTPHEVIMTGHSSTNGLTALNGAILPDSDATSEMAVANLDDEQSNGSLFRSRWSSWWQSWGRKRRAVNNEEYCFDGADREWNGNPFRRFGASWGGWNGRKRRSANATECIGSQGDGMIFQYPTGQIILGGIVQGQSDVEVDGNRRFGAQWGGWGRKRRSTTEKVNQVTPVHTYARWIYKTSGIWSKVEEQPAKAFDSASFSPESWKGSYPEFGLAALSRSVASLVDALPALQLINDNSVGQVVDMLSTAPAANQASGLDNIPLCGSSDRFAWDKVFGSNRFFWDKAFGRKRREATTSDQCVDLNLENLPICGLTGLEEDRFFWDKAFGSNRFFWDKAFGRKRREAGGAKDNSGVCIGDANLGKLMAGLLDRKAGDKSFNWDKIFGGNRAFNWDKIFG